MKFELEEELDMKKVSAIWIVCFLVFFSFIACGKKEGVSTTKSAAAENMFKLLPKEAQGAFFIDFHKAVTIEAFDEAMKSDKNFEDMQEFIDKTGIDPKQDIHYIGAAITGIENQNAALIINLVYNKEAFLGVINEKLEEEGTQAETVDYEGATIYTMTDEKGARNSFAFIDDSHIAAGNESEVKKVLDVVNDRAESLAANEELGALLKKSNQGAMVWGAIQIPQETMEKATSDNPFISSLESVRAISLYFDYKNKNIMAEINLASDDAAKNKEVADALNGLKSLGGMIGAEKPEIATLLNKITISSGADHVKIKADIPEDLINKLKSEFAPPKIED
jgi:hypothetical protein